MGGKIRAVVAIVWLVLILPTKCLEDIECYTRADGSDYRGHVSTTVYGKQCQQWTSQSPHEHIYTSDSYRSSGLGPHNYCRNPDGDPGPWCYTTDPLERFDWCDVGEPQIDCDTECYTRADGTDYRGHVSMTVSGIQCQQWTSQSPHEHIYTPDNSRSSGLGPHNYCRNPDGDPGPWCYTTDPLERYDWCDVGEPQIDCDTECYTRADGTDYRGHVSITVSGIHCQQWTSQSPQEHIYTPDNMDNYGSSGLGPHNYCRNPDGDPGPWCYTTDPLERYDWCDVGEPQIGCDTECYTRTDGTDYRGHVSMTVSGIQCQQWTSQSPHGHNYTQDNYPSSGLGQHNYCRNPDGDPGPWCYTTDPLERYDRCDVGEPQIGCDTDCLNLLGMKYKTIPDSSITASSALIDPNDNVFVYSGYQGRLDADASWLPIELSSSWVQVDFGYQSIKEINGIITQGSTWWDSWVETLQVKYGNDTAAPFVTILENDIPKTFDANTDASTNKTILFPATIQASVIRILPITWHVSVGLRWEIIGCNAAMPPTSTLSTTLSTTLPSKTTFVSINGDAPLDTWTLSIIGSAIVIVIAIVVGCLVLLAMRKKRQRESKKYLELQRRDDRKAESNNYIEI